ncbi:hypothetical protein diail_2329 [Diaporthe ilicicola]|nr:hypothetical protein diail_2329 [Diaporthe ilicicola]
MAVFWRQRRLVALAMALAGTLGAQAAFTNSSATLTSMASLPTGGHKVCEFAAGSVMIWDWHDAHTAATITHTIVPHITAYPNGSSVTNNETVLATATLPTNVSVSSTRVVSGFTMTYPSIWAEYSSFYSADCAMSTSTDVISEFTQTLTDYYGTPPSWTSTSTYPERTQLYTIQSGKGIILPATTDPARFFYRAEGWDYDGHNPATVTPPMLEYLAGLQTVVEQMSGQDVRTCVFATCAATAVGHSMVSATVLVESTEVAQAVFHDAPATTTSPPPPPANTPETTSPSTPPPVQQTSAAENPSPAGQQPPSQVPAEPEVSPPPQSSVEVITTSIEDSVGTPATTRDEAGPETTFVRTTTVDGHVEEQTVTSPVPVAAQSPGEVTLVREVTSNGQVLTETIVSVSAAPSAQASEVTLLVTTVTGPDGAASPSTMVYAAGPESSEVTILRTTISGGTEVVQTIISLSAAKNQGGGDAGGDITGAAQQTPALATSTRTVVSDGQTYVQTVVSPVETGGSPGETTFVRTVTSDGATFAQTVVSQLPAGGAGGNADAEGGATASSMSGPAGSAYTGPAVVGAGALQSSSAGKGLVVMAVVFAVGFMIDL